MEKLGSISVAESEPEEPKLIMNYDSLSGFGSLLFFIKDLKKFYRNAEERENLQFFKIFLYLKKIF